LDQLYERFEDLHVEALRAEPYVGAVTFAQSQG
jgi:hypothetical protein